jgi:hypothetical protein
MQDSVRTSFRRVFRRLGDILEVYGVPFSSAVFKWFSNPGPTKLYKLERKEDGVVWVTQVEAPRAQDKNGSVVESKQV